MPETAYRNAGTGRTGIYNDLSNNTGFTLQPEISGLLQDKGIPKNINAEELLQNFIQNGGKINPQSTTFKNDLSPEQTKAYEDYFRQVFGPANAGGQLSLF